MKQVLILVEGKTEKEFVSEVLKPFLFHRYAIIADATIISTSKSSRGGFVTYSKTKKEILKLLNSSNGLVTSMFDFYKIGKDYPGFKKLKNMNDSPQNKVIFLEKIWGKDIENQRFIPHFQLHEFEAILFCDAKPWEEWFDESESIKKIGQIINEFDNPENIDDHPLTAPSKRIKNIFTSYDKAAHGALIAHETSIETILEKCPHFRQWIELLVESCQRI